MFSIVKVDSMKVFFIYFIIHKFLLGISRDHWHKRRATGGKRKPIRKKRKFELGRPAANTKLGTQRIHTVLLYNFYCKQMIC